MANTDLIERLTGWFTDWNGERMVPGEPPRDGIHCDILMEAATALAEKDAQYERLASRMDAMAADNQRLRAECEGLRAASARDVLAERRRQIEAEGWHENHDNDHVGGELAKAAACYAIWDTIGGDEGIYIHGRWKTIVDLFWPWNRDWWKPSNPRRNLIKAGALILAEIDRIDRAALSQKESGDAA